MRAHVQAAERCSASVSYGPRCGTAAVALGLQSPAGSVARSGGRTLAGLPGSRRLNVDARQAAVRVAPSAHCSVAQQRPSQVHLQQLRQSIRTQAAASYEPGPIERSAQALGSLATALFPVWTIAAAVGGYHYPQLFTWFQTPHITYGLMFVMMGMGLTLTFQQISNVFTRQPQLLALGMVLQYSILPAIGYAISRYWGLEPGLAIGLSLVSCMPGGTASNIVAFIARGDMPLSVMMTSASTLMAVFMTPLLTTLLVGQLVPVDPKAMFMSVLQLVLAPVLIGCSINSIAPGVVMRVRPYMPLTATAVVVLIVGSLIANNVAIMGAYGMTVVPPIFLLHSCGFFLGYWLSKAMGTSDKVARTNSIETGMQSSALAAVLAKIHFPDQPMVVAACVVSACTHATVGSLLAGFWNATVHNWDA